MSEERDVELGRRLAELPVPDHGEGFWSRLEERLREETVDELAERRARRRPLAALVTAVAAAAALVVGAATLLQGDDTRRVTTTPTSAADQRVAQMVTGEATSVEAGSPAPMRQQYRFVRAIDGSYATTVVGTGETVAYDAAAGRTIQWFTHEGRIQAAEETGVAPGPPDRHPFMFVGDPALEDFVVGAAAARLDTIDEVEVAGRRAWRYRGPVTENQAAGTGVDAIEAAVDQETGVLLRLVEKADGEILREVEVSEFAVHPAIDRARTNPPPPAGAAVESRDLGFRRVAHDERGAQLPPSALVPLGMSEELRERWDVEGYWYAPASRATGPEASNPETKDVTAVSYRERESWRRVVATLRRRPDARPWEDPLRGEGQLFREAELELVDPKGRAVRGTTVLDPVAVPHAWGTTAPGVDAFVMTVAGAAAADELVDFAAITLPRRE